MTYPLPVFPPLFPHGIWWRLFVEKLLEGCECGECVEYANNKCGLKAREWMRFSIEGGNMISIPVAGGASALKNGHPSEWTVSKEYGREVRKMHSTLATIYGKTPFYSLIKDDLAECFEQEERRSEKTQPAKASDICLKSFNKIKELLELDNPDLIGMLREKIRNKDSFLIEMKRETEEDIDMTLSIIHHLSRHGKDAIFTLLPAF